MSSFGTFLTNGPYRRHRGKMDLHQRFLRESNKYFPKAIRPKVNVNPVVQYMTNQQRQKQETSFQTTMKYKNCSQIVPTMGLTNLIFYDCNKNQPAAPIDDSISQLMVPASSLAAENCHYESGGSPFFARQVISESKRYGLAVGGDVTNKSQEWLDNSFDEFVNVPQVLGGSVQDFTLSSNAMSNDQDFTLTSGATSNVFSPDVNSYQSFEMNLNHLAFEQNISSVVPYSDILPFEPNLDDRTGQFGNHVEHLVDDTFELNLSRQDGANISYVIDANLPNAAGFSSQMNSSEWAMTSVASQSQDESMAKFGVSSCSDISLDISVERDCYADFVPFQTSTPKSRNKGKSRISGLSDISGVSDEDLFLNQELQQEPINQPMANFTFSGKKSIHLWSVGTCIVRLQMGELVKMLNR